MTKPFTQGMTLRPGEATEFDLPVPLPEGAAELIHRGQLALEVKPGPRLEDAPGKFHADLEIWLGQRLYATCQICWEARPATRWERLVVAVRRIWRK